MIANIQADITANKKQKDHLLYMDTMPAIYIIYNLRFYININLDPIQKCFETFNSYKI